MNFKEKMQRKSGITLISLVVTIVILLILAGITIGTLTGNNGILTRASEAKEKTRAGEINERISLVVSENQIAEYSNGRKITKAELVSQLKTEGKLKHEEVALLETQDVITIGGITIDFSILSSQSGEITVNGYTYASEAEYNYLNSVFGNKKISILGDSISTLKEYIPDGYASYYSLSGSGTLIDSVESTYWGSIIKRFNMTLGINGSWSGSTISNTNEEDSDPFGPNIAMASNTRIQALDDNGTPDIIIFYGGTNDYFQGYTIGKFDCTADYANVLDLETYKWDTVVEAYSTAILRLKYYYPSAKIIALFPHVANSNWNEGMKAVCNYLDVNYVNLIPANISDTHPNSEQFDILTNYILNTLYEKHIEQLKDEAEEQNIKLPDGYTKLNYIETTGIQYLDTEIIPTNNTRWELKAQFENLSTTQNNGVLDSTSNNGFQIGMTNSGNFTLNLGTSSDSSYYDNYIHNFIIDAQNLRIGVDDTFYGNKTINNSGFSSSIYIGARNRINSSSSQSVQNYITEKVYSSKIYENGELVQFLVPCTNDSGIHGMYDVVNGKFYSSATSNDFIAGN